MARIFRNPFEPTNKKAIDFPPLTTPGNYPYVTEFNKPEAFWNRWNTQKSIEEGMKASEWVYIAVNRIAQTASSIPWRVYRRLANDEREPYSAGDPKGLPHPIEQLLNEPNPYMNGNDFFELLTQHLYLGGNAIDRATMLAGVPIALAPLMPDLVDINTNNKGVVTGYKVYPNENSRNVTQNYDTVSSEEILHIKFTDPNNLYWGLSPLQAVAKTVDTDVEAITWNKISLQNRAVSTGAFVVNQALSPEQYTQLREMIKEQHQGSANAYSPWLLSFGADWRPMSLTPQELDFIQSRKMNRESIIAVYNVPPPLAGIYDSATFNNIVTARKSFWLDTVIPYLDNVKAALTFYFKQFKAFGTDWILDYDTTTVEALKPEFNERITAARTLFTMGVPLNVLNVRFELDLPTDLEYGDTEFVSGVQTAESVSSGTATPPTSIQQVAAGNNDIITLGYPNIKTVEGRNEIWAKTDNARKKYETQLEKIAFARLKEDYKYIADSFANDGIVPNLDTVKWKKKMLPAAINIVFDHGSKVMADIKKEAMKFSPQIVMQNEFDFNLTDEIMNFLNDWFEIRAAIYNETTLESVYRIIKQGQEEGLNTREIAVRVDESGALQEYRAVRISRTETVGLQNYSTMQSAKQSDVVEQKVWVSSRDSRVRDTHRDADGQIVGIDESFMVDGIKMKYPGDPNGSAAEVINCRCAISYVLKNTEKQKSKYEHEIILNGKHK